MFPVQNSFRLLKLVGIQNRDTPAAIAITASLTCLNGREPSSGRVKGADRSKPETPPQNNRDYEYNQYSLFSWESFCRAFRAHGQSTSLPPAISWICVLNKTFVREKPGQREKDKNNWHTDFHPFDNGHFHAVRLCDGSEQRYRSVENR